jgi:hypothetical protein
VSQRLRIASGAYATPICAAPARSRVLPRPKSIGGGRGIRFARDRSVKRRAKRKAAAKPINEPKGASFPAGQPGPDNNEAVAETPRVSALAHHRGRSTGVPMPWNALG